MQKFVLIILLLCSINLKAQSPLTSNLFNYHLVDRYEITQGKFSPDLFTTVKPFSSQSAANFSQNLSLKSATDSFNRDYLQCDNLLFSNKSLCSRKPLLKHFYEAESALFKVKTDDFKLVVNPVLAFSGGMDNNDTLNNYRNSRGFEVRGSIADKVGFYTYVLENQQCYPNYLREKHQQTGVINGATLHKGFGEEAEDYFNVAGYVTVSPIEQIMVQFGQDRNFIGNGYRSLILSDNAAPNLFLKLNTKVWKLNYMNLFSEHSDFIKQGEGANNPKKYSAFHHLSLNITDNLNIGLFENIVFDRQDSTEQPGFELAYLNPLIFYRAVEHGLNSRDNAILGMDLKWNFLKRFSFYGQLVLDEFNKDELVGRTKNWANKWASQAGLKYINVANVNNLDAQLEVNQIRPYVFQHRTKSQNWIHYNQSLAHPLGSNLREIIGRVRYQPIDRLSLDGIFSLSKQGIDSLNGSLTFGGDYTSAYSNIPDHSYAPMFQGVENTIQTVSLNLSYMAWHNLFFDLGFILRNENNATWQTSRTNVILTFGMRLNANAFNYRQ